MDTNELTHLISDATITDITEERIIEMLINILDRKQLEIAHRDILAEWREEGGDVSAHESTEYGDAPPDHLLAEKILTDNDLYGQGDVICEECDHPLSHCLCE